MGKTDKVKLDNRQNKTGKDLSEPKDGAGGKGTWGKPGVDDLKEIGDDPKDMPVLGDTTEQAKNQENDEIDYKVE